MTQHPAARAVLAHEKSARRGSHRIERTDPNPEGRIMSTVSPETWAAFEAHVAAEKAANAQWLVDHPEISAHRPAWADTVEAFVGDSAVEIGFSRTIGGILIEVRGEQDIETGQITLDPPLGLIAERESLSATDIRQLAADLTLAAELIEASA